MGMNPPHKKEDFNRMRNYTDEKELEVETVWEIFTDIL